jgi:hypothetical protein
MDKLNKIHKAVVLGHPESYIDMFVMTLLETLGFQYEPRKREISVLPKTSLKVHYRHHPHSNIITQIAIPDVVIQLSNTSDIFLLVCEDKPRKHSPFNELFAQVVIQAVAVYSLIYEKYSVTKNGDSLLDIYMSYQLPFIIVADSKFYFFFIKNMDKKYIESLREGYKPNDYLEVVQCCKNPSAEEGFDFRVKNDRKRIIQMLMYFKNIIYDFYDKVKPEHIKFKI